MKLLLIAALAVFASAHAEEEVKYDGGRYILFPDGDGVPQLVDLEEKYEPWTPEIALLNLNNVRFQLFTRANPRNAQILTLNQINTVTGSNFRNTRGTRFLTHGWRSSPNSQAVTVPRDAYLAAGDYNVIAIDWSSIASATYNSASGNVRNVAGRVAEFINFMNQRAALNLGTLHMAGHSLGGHLVSLAARATRGNVNSVIALDPAGPGFENAAVGSRTDRTDANHVQIIHTNAGLLGMSRQAGDSDFYPNGGRSQPGCGIDVGL